MLKKGEGLLFSYFLEIENFFLKWRGWVNFELGAPALKSANFFKAEKKLFLMKNIFFYAIYCSESFTNVNYR